MAAADAALLGQGHEAITAIVTLASSCPAGGDPRWDATLAELGVEGLAADARARHLREGPGQRCGALLLELRWALDAAVAPLCKHMDEPWQLTNAVDQAVRDYVGAVRPVVTTASIFANALAGAASSPAAMVGSADASAECCRCCGAPRQDRSDLSCRYCGQTS
ncbi:hypothetical protein ENSA5_27090 [Enhygromyxa salina]|uniref:Uncharacterized protein n=1 Tax=Enhygromyxa salina TaxID=215803 RepID=A0A2S9Y7G3_9BACT|nr:hypothetical protein [Enhygromyxa salina]PRQ01027.1 hypothetical protein ENSA5_27090 [Enhygromyxa salina]